MIETEARVRATFQAVASATALHPEYVEQPRRRRRLAPALAGVAAAVVGLALLAPDRGVDQPPASQPAEGRLLAEGDVGGRHWTLRATENGCVVLAIEGRTTTAPRCAAEHPDVEPDSTWFEQLETTPEGNEVVLVGAVSADVEKVLVATDDRPATEAKIVADPQAGVHYLVAFLERGHKTRQVTIHRGGTSTVVVDSNVGDAGS